MHNLYVFFTIQKCKITQPLTEIYISHYLYIIIMYFLPYRYVKSHNLLTVEGAAKYV